MNKSLQKRFIYFLFCLSIAILSVQLTGCSTFSGKRDSAPTGKINVAKIPDAVPKTEPFSKYGNPRSYRIHGKYYHVLKTFKGYNKVGFASWYGTKFHNRLTSTHERYSVYAMTAASRDLPIPCYVRVTNLENGRSAIVKVNDRGPFVGNRIIDLSYVAALKLGYANRGTTLVRVTAIDPNAHYAQTNVEKTRFYLQLGAFRDAARAEGYKIRIANLTSVPVYVKAEGGLYRVQAGPLAANESNDLREKLEASGLAPAMTVLG